MKRRVLGVVAAATMGLSLAGPTAPANAAASFCASKIGTATYYQHDFSSGGTVVATICAPGYDTAGNAYLYARGRYANILKYMKLTIVTSGSAPAYVDGNYYENVYRAQPAGRHDYTALMYDGNGNRIVNNATAIDYE